MAEPVKTWTDSSLTCVVKKENPVIYISSPSPSSSSEGTPPRPITCLKNMEDVKRYEEREECFILDFDPTSSIDISKLSLSKDLDDDLSVIAETGKVSLRDYPHSRHMCVKYPFNTTSHEIHCELCYCYVCDSTAPCDNWEHPQMAHCHAADNVAIWDLRRVVKRQGIHK